ncbi:endoplasmic reticulum membrane sensor NFE2L1-like isoform X2 [Babylonia areolata]|uniref:endoplasmic reticulum membrane sensor NFE2L1-like isoform X2 n=1 Tax=Babylonia areolata TaxID=304850 RepID=UPI003FD1DE1B
MIKQYLGDGFIQIAILLSLLRTDLNNLAVPNNEILNYPEVQDILQGQTLAYLPTSFHNQYNTLHSIHGLQNPKHIDDVYFSSLFNNWRFRRVSTNIEAFLVSCDGTCNLPIPPHPPPEQNDAADLQPEDAENNNAPVASASAEAAHADYLVDANQNSVVFDSDFFNHPFPGLGLSKEDLDLIEVLWRQDVDLGVGKEVFDPNLRKELEQERELELRKEQEKRKEVERREQERQQQAQQWLSQNFIRDGETGELMPIGGNSSYSPPAPPNAYSEQVNHSYGQQPPQQQQPAAATATSSSQLLYPEDLQYLAENLTDEAQGHSYPNQTEQERLEQSWKEVVEQIFTNTTTTTNNNSTTTATTAPNTNTTSPNTLATASSMLPGEDQSLLPPAPNATTFLAEPPFFHQPPPQPHPSQLNASMDFLLAEQQQNSSTTNSSMSSAASMTETRRLLERQNSTDVSHLEGLLQNASLPLLALDSNLSVLDIQPVANETDMMSAVPPPTQGMFSQLELDGADLLFQNSTDLVSFAGALNSTDLLSSTGLLNEILPGDDFDLPIDDGLDTIQSMVDEAASDSAISMASGSPQQEVNETMQMSPYDGLEGATGGSDYDTSSYGHHRSQMHSSGSTEEENYQYSCSSYGSPASVSTNCSTGSNDTEHSSGHSSASLHHIYHNHTYPTQPGQVPREVKKYAKKDGPRQKGPHSRDMKRAADLNLPFTFEQIVGSPVEEFNDLLTKTKLTEPQIALMRDIRRRGKNKVAAQNCRKRKLDVLVNLEDEMTDMEKMRDKLVEERRRIDQETRRAKEKYAALYEHIFSSLRDEDGRPFSRDQYSLQQSSNGNVFLVQQSTGSATSPLSSSSASSLSSSSSSSSSLSHHTPNQPPSGSRRGKDCDPQQQHKGSSAPPPQKKKNRE